MEFRLLKVKEHDLSSPVVIGADEYIAAKTTRCRNFEIGYGYSFESVCLYARSLGIGTVILAASISRKTFEKAMDLKENQKYTCHRQMRTFWKWRKRILTDSSHSAMWIHER